MTLRYGGDDHEARCDEAGGDDWVHGQGRRTGLPRGPPLCRARGGVGWTRTVQSCRVATLSMTCAIHGTVALAKLLRLSEGFFWFRDIELHMHLRWALRLLKVGICSARLSLWLAKYFTYGSFYFIFEFVLGLGFPLSGGQDLPCTR